MPLSTQQLRTIIFKASTALAEYCIAHGIKNTVTGVSGGLDSAVTIFLSQEAVKVARERGHELRSIGLILPCQSDEQHSVLGKKVIQACGAELVEIDLTSIFEFAERALMKPLSNLLAEYHDHDREGRYRTAQGNVKARMRMAFGTYYVANLVNGLVLSTDNYSEYWMGFWTLHGDVGDFGMIQELWKGSELIQVAEALGVPQSVIDAAPTDGLNVLPGGDEAQLGAKYPVVDQVLQALIKQGIDLNGSLDQLNHLPEVEGVDQELVRKIAERALRNGFKRKNPVNLKRGELGLPM